MNAKSKKSSGRFWLGAVFGVVIVLVIGAVAFFGYRQLDSAEAAESKPTISSTTIKNSFNEIAELSVEEYNFTNVGEFKNDGRKIWRLNVPLTGKSFLVTYDGTVKAGVRDFTAATVDVDNVARVIRVEVPHAEITNSEIDTDSAVVYDQTMNPTNQIRFEDVADFIKAEKGVAEKKATEAGLLQRSEDRIEHLVETNIHALMMGTEQEGYSVEINWI